MVIAAMAGMRERRAAVAAKTFIMGETNVDVRQGMKRENDVT